MPFPHFIFPPPVNTPAQVPEIYTLSLSCPLKLIYELHDLEWIFLPFLNPSFIISKVKLMIHIS